MDEQQAIDVLKWCRKISGRYYKARIRRGWTTGNYMELSEKAGELQWIRNSFGPRWLVTTTLPKEKK